MDPIFTFVGLPLAIFFGIFFGQIELEAADQCDKLPSKIEKLLEQADQLLITSTSSQRETAREYVEKARAALLRQQEILENSSWGAKEQLRATILEIAESDVESALRILRQPED